MNEGDFCVEVMATVIFSSLLHTVTLSSFVSGEVMDTLYCDYCVALVADGG